MLTNIQVALGLIEAVVVFITIQIVMGMEI